MKVNQNDVIVSICCITYNHVFYIRNAIEGFLMQKTTFPIEILIHDDASTDGTEEIIREYEAKYPELIKPLYETENQWIKGRRGSMIFNFPRASGKYIALCEGDDYWTDPYKLQKQVDILEANNAVSVCVHDYLDYDEAEGKFLGRHNAILAQEGDLLEFQTYRFDIWIYQPLTCMIRSSCLVGIDSSPFKYWRDIHLFYILSRRGKVCYLNECMGVYRHHKQGMHQSMSEDNRRDISLKIWCELGIYFNDDKHIRYNFYNELTKEIIYLIRYFLFGLKKVAVLWGKSFSISFFRTFFFPIMFICNLFFKSIMKYLKGILKGDQI